MFKCTVCHEILEPHRCRTITDESHCELYICCPCCGGECENYDKEDNTDGELI